MRFGLFVKYFHFFRKKINFKIFYFLYHINHFLTIVYFLFFSFFISHQLFFNNIFFALSYKKFKIYLYFISHQSLFIILQKTHTSKIFTKKTNDTHALKYIYYGSIRILFYFFKKI
jgi:hypothetical protein